MTKTFDTSKIACTTFYTIDRIAEEWWKHWWDAILLYFKYQEKSNIDLTNQPRATDKYMMKWLWWWKDKFYGAKNVLTKLWLVESVQWNSNWKFWKTYIRVNFMMKPEWVNTALLENRTPENQVSGKSETNAYSTKVSACSTEVSAGSDFQSENPEQPQDLNEHREKNISNPTPKPTKEELIIKLKERLETENFSPTLIEHIIEYWSNKKWTKLYKYWKAQTTAFIKMLKTYPCDDAIIALFDKCIANNYQWIWEYDWKRKPTATPTVKKEMKAVETAYWILYT